jgi:hypothetical protein
MTGDGSNGEYPWWYALAFVAVVAAAVIIMKVKNRR